MEKGWKYETWGKEMEKQAQRTGAGWTDREIKGKEESSGEMRVTGKDEAGKRERWLNK